MVHVKQAVRQTLHALSTISEEMLAGTELTCICVRELCPKHSFSAWTIALTQLACYIVYTLFHSTYSILHILFMAWNIYCLSHSGSRVKFVSLELSSAPFSSSRWFEIFWSMVRQGRTKQKGQNRRGPWQPSGLCQLHPWNIRSTVCNMKGCCRCCCCCC